MQIPYQKYKFQSQCEFWLRFRSQANMTLFPARLKEQLKLPKRKFQKRWCPDAMTSSEVSQNTNLICAQLKEECNNSFRMEENYTVFAEMLVCDFGGAYGFCENIKIVCDPCDDISNGIKTSKWIVNESKMD
ncbi:hypothetical protein TNCV_2046131 [Trichonephila clavipes]|uniref:Uncharacterized protein n=1 Tax=Trichonephila clavipes TaxID=2585209 RepID=A0A8X6SZA5_TRICX|nr:hypothetical protein TNCV_2046131 [Trichonephila clavipes]